MIKEIYLARLPISLCLLFAIGVGCWRQHETMQSLDAELPFFEDRTETRIIEFENRERKRFFAEGWSDFEYDKNRSMVWAVGERASLRLFFWGQWDRMMNLEIMAAQDLSRPQSMTVWLNGQLIFQGVVEARWKQIEVPINKEDMVSGENTFEFRFVTHQQAVAPRKTRQTGQEGRQLAVAFDRLRIDPLSLPPDRRRLPRRIPSSVRIDDFGSTKAIRQNAPGRWAISVETPEIDPRLGVPTLGGKLTAQQSKGEKLVPAVSLSARADGVSVPGEWQLLNLKSGQQVDFEIPMGQFSGKLTELEFSAVGPSEDEVALDLIWHDLSITWPQTPGAASTASRKISPIAREQRETRPNIIIVLADTAAAAHFPFNGYFRETAPNIGQVAKLGQLFPNVYSTAPYTRAATASLFTSLGPEAHQVVHGTSVLDDPLTTMAEIFESHGYRTAAFAANPNVSAIFGFDQGWQTFVEVNRQGNYDSYIGSFWPHLFPWLESQEQQPFLLYLHFREPHAYYEAPEGFLGHFDPEYQGTFNGHEQTLRKINARHLQPDQRDIDHIIALYDELIRYMDHEVGELRQKLELLGLWRESIFVFLSDHGEAFLQHDVLMHNVHNYEEMVRIPMVWKLPESWGVAPRRIETDVSILDVLPTLVELLAIDDLGALSFQGRSMVPLFEGRDEPGGRAFFFRTSQKWPIYGLRLGRYKYLEESYDGRPQLYDLVDDPGEKNNLAATMPITLRWYRQRLQMALEVQRNLAQGSRKLNLDSIDPEILEQMRTLGYGSWLKDED